MMLGLGERKVKETNERQKIKSTYYPHAYFLGQKKLQDQLDNILGDVFVKSMYH